LSDVTRRALESEGLVADVAQRGEQALAALGAAAYDVVILDVGLPDLDGFAVCRMMRERSMWSPVLMLTARTAVGDRVDGLDAGADDYLGKPFAVEELLARVRALARRGPVVRAPVLEAGDLRLNPATHEAWRGETPIDLSLREFALLEALMRHPGQVLSRDTLLDQAWPMGSEQRSNVVEVYVRYVREKIDRPFGVASLENVRGAGYRLRRDGGR
jgi:two-component system OmpR family response regulator